MAKKVFTKLNYINCKAYYIIIQQRTQVLKLVLCLTNTVGCNFSLCLYTCDIVQDMLLADGQVLTNENMEICIVEADW